MVAVEILRWLSPGIVEFLINQQKPGPTVLKPLEVIGTKIWCLPQMVASFLYVEQSKWIKMNQLCDQG